MIKRLQHIFALSEKGAKDLIKAVIWCFVCNLSLMIPVGVVMMTVQHLLDCLESGGNPMDGFWLYVGLLWPCWFFSYIALVSICFSVSGDIPGECESSGQPGGNPTEAATVLFWQSGSE